MFGYLWVIFKLLVLQRNASVSPVAAALGGFYSAGLGLSVELKQLCTAPSQCAA